jgi:hypothetical protein
MRSNSIAIYLRLGQVEEGLAAQLNPDIPSVRAISDFPLPVGIVS